MISKEQFIYRVKTEVFPILLLTERARIMALLEGEIFILAGCFFLICALNDIKRVFDDEKLFKAFGTIITLCISFGLYIWHHFVHKQKQIFSPTFLSFLGQLENKQKSISSSLLRHSCFFRRFNFDRTEYDDCISGTFEDTQFSVAEFKLINDNRNRSYTLFKGICIDIPMKIPVSGYTLLYNTKIPQKIPVLKKISLEDVSFDKNYQVYSDSQIDARVLLTPAFMEKLNNLKRCFKKKRIDVSFFGNQAVFIIHTWQNLFESYPLFRKITNVKTYEKFYDEIKAIYEK